MGRISKSHTLMIVEDPRETILTLCKMQNTIINWKNYKKEYEKTIDRINKPISRGTADCHFYSLTQMNFLEELENNKSNYIISLPSKKLCSLLKNNDITKYKRRLRNMLLYNDSKGELFQQFITYIKDNKSRNKQEIYDKFKSETSRALISWCLEAGLIEYDYEEEIIWALETNEKVSISLDRFWDQVRKTYLEIEKSNIFGISRIFISIAQLRNEISAENNWSLDDFDSFFTNLLNSKYGRQVRLYGGPSSTFEGKRNFFYQNKLYVYLRLRI